MFCFSNENEICFVSSPELKFPEFLDAPVFSEYPSVHRDFDSLAMGGVNNTDVEFGSGGGDQMVLDGQGLVCLSIPLLCNSYLYSPSTVEAGVSSCLSLPVCQLKK
jgi:hypothetical protein